MSALRRGMSLVSCGIVSVLVLSGCSGDVTDLPLPGGTDTGDNPMQVTAEFANVLDLVPQSTVKVNDVSVGKIAEIELDGETALVTLELPRDTDLPGNAVAEIRQTSLLGEKFVELSPPDDAAEGRLEDGDVIDLDQTGRNPEVEEVLGALSLLLNGGGVAQLKTIASELNLALEGREESVKSAFRQIEDLMSQLDDGKADIVRAIEGLNRLSISVNDQIGTIDAALQELPSALRTLDQQRGDLVRMLKALNRLGDVGVRVVRESKQATIQSFRQLVPVLTKFSESGDAFVDAFNVFLTYPFVDEVIGRDPQVARNLHMGDYTNLSVTLDIDLKGRGSTPEVEVPGGPGIPEIPVPEIPDPVQTLNLAQRCLRSGDITSRPCQRLLREPRRFRRICNRPRNRDNPVCRQVRSVTNLGNLLSGGGGGTGGGGGGGGGGVPNLPNLPGTGGGLPRAAFGETRDFGPQGPTMGELMELYDRDLVTLLVPGMVTR